MYANHEFQTDELPLGTTLLHGQYVIESFLARGGFGITYLARDSLDRLSVIKECFPSAICCRADGQVMSRSVQDDRQYEAVLRHFLREARRLAKLKHQNIVGVHQVFEENGTAYMALDFVDGEDLWTVLEDSPERLTADIVRAALENMLDAIRYVHSHEILHRDISPDNILMDANGELTLIDFGSSHEFLSKENRALSALLSVKDGYSPHEFYVSDTSQTPSSDLYSLGATFYHLLTGEAPPDSQTRLAALAGNAADPYRPLVDIASGYDLNFLATIDRALEVLQKDRLQSATEWLHALEHGLPEKQVSTEENPDLGPGLQTAILQLVEDTNASIQVGLPWVMRNEIEAREKSRSEPQDDGPKELVDIFGNPIIDVEKWMREQDRSGHRDFKGKARNGSARRGGLSGRGRGTDGDDTAEPAAGPVSTIGRFVGSCLKRRWSTGSTTLQNGKEMA